MIYIVKLVIILILSAFKNKMENIVAVQSMKSFDGNKLIVILIKPH